MTEYRYGMRLRGFSIGCQPKQGFVKREDSPTREFYDILVYDRALTEDEIRAYDLQDLNGPAGR